jgi:hypothetical protein
MKGHEYPTFLDWWIANLVEYKALSDAEDGNPFPLAELIEAKGYLVTKEARKFVAAQVKGEKKSRGSKRTIAQQAKEIAILGILRDIQKELDSGEHTARAVFLERHSNICSNEDSLRTYVKRAKKTLEQMFGRKPPPVVQQRGNSEPD